MDGLHINYFKGLKFANQPCKMKVRVRSVTPHEDKFIIGLDLVDEKNKTAIQEALNAATLDEDGRTDISIETIPDMTANVWDVKDLPTKGEIVTVTIEQVAQREENGGGTVLGVTRVAIAPVVEGSSLNLDEFFTDESGSSAITEQSEEEKELAAEIAAEEEAAK